MASLSSCVDDEDVARYVLAYLMEMNYSQTTASFLQECEFLQQTSSDNVMILPRTPLKELVDEYKARQSTGVMLKTLGVQQAWKSLWSKLQQTLNEISSLAQDSMTPSNPTITFNNRSSSKRTIKSHSKSLRPPPPLSVVSIPSPSTSAMSPSSITNVPIDSPMSPSVAPLSSYPSNIPVVSVDAPQPPPLPLDVQTTLNLSSVDNRSPRKKRIQTPKRKEVHEGSSVTMVSPSNSSTTDHQSDDVQQLLSSLLTNEELPWRLAELINKHVGGGSDSQLSLPVTITNIDESTSTAIGAGDNSQWLDDLINSVFPSDTNPVSPKTPPLSQDSSVEAVSAEVVPALEHSSGSESHAPPSIEDHTHKRTLKESEETKSAKRPKPNPSDEGSRLDPLVDRMRPDPPIDGLRPNPLVDGLRSGSLEESGRGSHSLQLPDNVNLEYFLDQIHK